MAVLDDDPTRDWTRLGVYRVASGVHRIPLPLPDDGLRAVNVYALEEDDGITLIDSGQVVGDAKQLLVEGLAELDAGLHDVRRFLVTHHHRDHYSQAVLVRREVGSHIILGEPEAESLWMLREEAHGRPPFLAQLTLLAEAGASDVARALVAEDGSIRHDGASLPPDIWEDADEWIGERAEIHVGDRVLDAVLTPGHTRGHVVFHDLTAGILFAGDHVLPHITPSVGFETAVTAQPLRDYLQSLQVVLDRPDAMLVPAHGPVGGTVHARVRELLDHHATRLGATARRVEEGRHTAAEVADGLVWTRRERHIEELDPFNAMLAVLETKTHLDLLVLQGRLRREEHGGVVHYVAGDTAMASTAGPGAVET